MALIDLEELKEVLGVGDIYPDATLQEVADTASNVLISFLKLHRAGIVEVELSSNVATFTTRRAHEYVVGQSVVVSLCGAPFDGTRTVTTVPTVYKFTAAITNANITARPIIPDGKVLLSGQATYYDDVPEIREAALMVAVDVWNARQSAQGQAQSLEFNPGPYRMGRSLVSRVAGLISGYRDVGGMVG